jgi:hypothetical protein
MQSIILQSLPSRLKSFVRQQCFIEPHTVPYWIDLLLATVSDERHLGSMLSILNVRNASRIN